MPETQSTKSPDPADLAKAITQYAEWCGGVHDQGCPEDDTCSCSGKPVNDGVNATVLYLLDARWHPIVTAPKTGLKVDIWAKCWLPESDSFIYQRFPGCYWNPGDSMTNRSARWAHLDSGWHATHWMPIADGPEGAR